MIKRTLLITFLACAGFTGRQLDQLTTIFTDVLC